MKHLFVIPKLAFKLKKKDFNEPCFGYYENQSKVLVINYTTLPPVHPQAKKRPSMFDVNNMNSELPQWATSAPTYQQVADWFRDNHNINITINPQHELVSEMEVACGSQPNGKYCGTLDDITKGKQMLGSDTICLIPTAPTYYKAFSKAIEEALKRIKKLPIK